MRRKRMKIKRLWSLLLVTVMSLSLVSTSVVAGEQAGGAGSDIVSDVDSSSNVGNTDTNNVGNTDASNVGNTDTNNVGDTDTNIIGNTDTNNTDGSGTNNPDGIVDENLDETTNYTVKVTLPPSYEDEEEAFECADNSGALEQTISEGGAIENIVLTYDMGEYSDESALSEMMMSWADAVNTALADTGLTAVYKAEDKAIIISGRPTKDVNLNLEEVLGNYETELLGDGTHEHCICGNHKTSGCDHDSKLTWTAVDDINEIKGEGNYYLTQDQTLNSAWQCKYNVNLCLNGKSVTGASGSAVIEVVSGASLTITDCKYTAGKITHNNTKGQGINNKGTLVLWNGSITGNTTDARSGGGVRNEGAFTMYGGNISNNTASGYNGGGVYNYENQTFTMYGGSITGNTAQYGGGVDNDGSMTMSGGSISGNTATDKGGGIYEEGVSLTVSGAVRIKGNTKGGAANNVYLTSSLTGSHCINVNGSVSEGTRIGITSENPSGKPTVVKGSEMSSSATKYFVSDDSAYATRVNAENTGLYLGAITSEEKQTHCICGDHDLSGCDGGVHDWIYVESLDEIDDNGYYALKNDVALTGTWTCDHDVYLCLNGKTITGADGKDAIVVSSNKSLTITDCSDEAGKITHTSGSGRGIYNYGTFTLWNGAITDNTVSGINNHGGGVCNKGTFTMNGGSISNNGTNNYNCGGGVCNNSTFTMNGGNISNNSTNQYGGGVYNDGGTFTMNGGNISDNHSSWLGGGVCNENDDSESTFILNGGTIKNNDAVNYNRQSGNGGGVFNDNNCTFTMTGGSITENSARKLAGGGVYNCGNFTITGGSITKNIASAIGGGGVYQSAGSLIMSGSPVIKDNTAGSSVNNAYVDYDSVVTVAAPGMSKDAEVGISGSKGASAVVTGSTDDKAFFSDDSKYELVDNGENGLKFNQHKHCVCGATNCGGDGHDATAIWKGISDLSDITADGNYYLKSNIELSDTWICDYDVKLCLNGKTIYGANGKDVIDVTDKGSLTITDCNENVGSISHKDGQEGRGITNEGKLTLVKGNITGNKSSSEGGGVYNKAKGTFTMTGGSIKGNVAELYGGGVSNTGTFEMSGGEIAGNTLEVDNSCGGGVYNCNTGKFNMTGGCIGGDNAGDGNSAEKYGGGVCNDRGTVTIAGKITGNSADQGGGVYNYDGTIEMTGSEISNNTATTDGGGVYMYSGAFTVSGSTKISDNKGGNVYLPSGKVITVGNKGLTNDANIGITGTKDQTVVSGTSSNANFFSDKDSYLIVKNDTKDGLKLIEPEAHNHCVCGKDTAAETTHTHDSATSWKPLSGTATTLTDGNYYLYDDITLDSDSLTITGTVNLCLNGKTITGADGKPVIQIEKGASLNITDCNENAGNITHAEDEDGFGVYNSTAGTLILWNGNITGNSDESGGGVTNSGTFTMYGGSISNNSVGIIGGGVYNDGKFTMVGGIIAKNESGYIGGGVCNAEPRGSFTTDVGTFTMTGGTITGNTAKYVGGGAYNYDEFIMTGGSITGNTCKEAQGCAGGIANMGILKISGNVNVTGNKVADADDNVGLLNFRDSSDDDDQDDDDQDDDYQSPTITVDGNLAETSRVGVSAYKTKIDLTVVNGSTNTGIFTSDDTNYDLIDNGNGGLKFSYKISGVAVKNSADGNEMTDGKKVYDGKAVAYTEGTLTPSDDGAFLTYTWQMKSGDTYVDIEGNVAPSAIGNYRLLVSAVKEDLVKRTVEYQFEITKEDEPVTPDDPDSGDDSDDSGKDDPDSGDKGGNSGNNDSDSGKDGSGGANGSGGSDGSGSADSGNSGSGSANSNTNNSGTAVSGSAAKTGDSGNMMLWIILMILSGAGFVSIARVIGKARK